MQPNQALQRMQLKRGFGMVKGGIMTVRFTYRPGAVRIFGAGYWRQGKVIYERENEIHK